MKKAWLMGILAALIMIACNKNDDADNSPKTNSDLLIGSWTTVLLESYTLNNANNDTAFYFTLPGAFMNFSFNANGSVITTAFGDTAVGTYTVSGNNFLMISEGDTISGEITTLNTNTLIVENATSYIKNSVSFTDYEYLELSR